MSDSSIEFHKIWIDQCTATEGIREHFGLKDALDYLVGEKLFAFVVASERDTEFAAEVPAFVQEIRRIFTPTEIRDYLDHLERIKFLAPIEPDLDIDDDGEIGDEAWRENPVMGAEELLRCRNTSLYMASVHFVGIAFFAWRCPDRCRSTMLPTLAP